MSEIVARTGADTWVRDDHKNRNQGTGNTIQLQAVHRRGLIHIPLTNIRGRTVLSATLTGHVRDGFAAQTVTLKALTSWVGAGKATWNNQPATVGAGVATVLSALSDGDAAVLGLTSIVQGVANGAAWHGVQITTSAAAAGASDWYAFDAAKPAWVLTVELSDAPEQPTHLGPSGGGAIGSPAPILSWSYVDLGGTSSEQGAFKVQADADGDFTSPAFDSGWVISADPQFDLSTSAFTPLASGASTTWRVMTRDADGNESAWSDPAVFTYTPSPTLVVDSPTGGTIGDPTPSVLFHMTGETMTQWRVRVLDTANNELYDSKLSDGPGAAEIPWRDPETDKRIIRTDDATYRFDIRAWGDVDRAVGVGHPAYVQQIVDVVFDDDAGVEVPTDFTVAAFAPGDPRTTFSWTLVEAGDSYQIIETDSGHIFASIDADEVTVDAGRYTWTDHGQVQPYEAHTYTVHKVDIGTRGTASNADTYTSKPEGAWLIPEDDDPIMLDGDVWLDSAAQTEKRVSYATLTGTSDIDVVYALMGITGQFQGALYQDGDPNTPGVMAAARRLERLRQDVSALPQFVFLTKSITIRMRAASTLPASTFDENNRQHNVAFGFQQVGD